MFITLNAHHTHVGVDLVLSFYIYVVNNLSFYQLLPWIQVLLPDFFTLHYLCTYIVMYICLQVFNL